MKRYILKLALFALSIGSLVSCDEDTVTYNGKNFVTFDRVSSTRFNAFENIGVSELPINMAFPQSNDVVVTFEVTNSTAVEGTDYVLLTPNSVTIPAGETSANIRIQITNNEILDDSKSLEITLTGVNDGNVNLGLVDDGSKFKRFLIVNDDCTTNFLPFVRTYNVYDDENLFVGTAEADVNDNGDCNVLRLTGFLLDITGTPTDPGNFIDVTLAPLGSNKNAGTISGVQQLYCTECYDDGQAEQTVLIAITGQFINTTIANPEEGTLRMTINSQIYFASSNAPVGSRTLTLLPAN